MHVRPVRTAEICARLASKQKGIVGRRQLLAAGLSRHLIDALIKEGFLHPIHRGIYAVGHTALAPLAMEQAALFACGAPAFVSCDSALYVWSVIESPPAEVHITAVGHHCRKRPGIRLHLSPTIDKRDTRIRHGLQVTRHLAPWSSSPLRPGPPSWTTPSLRRALKLVRSGELEAALDRAGLTPGASNMRRFLRAEDGPGITRSRAERRFRRYLREARLPPPRTNVAIAGVNADFLWRDERVIVEVDSWQFHGHRRAFERDRKKDMILRDAGYVVIRVTWRQFTEDLLALIAHIARTLGRAANPRSP